MSSNILHNLGSVGSIATSLVAVFALLTGVFKGGNGVFGLLSAIRENTNVTKQMTVKLGDVEAATKENSFKLLQLTTATDKNTEQIEDLHDRVVVLEGIRNAH